VWSSGQEAVIARACQQCGRAAEPDDRFCGSCGTALPRSCARCGRDLPADVAFCTSCGLPVGEPQVAQPRRSVHEDRRRISVLFIDVVNFTHFSEQSDPERVRQMQNTFFATVRQVVGQYGGVVEKYIGDAVMVLFGAPVTTETDTVRCVRAGLELQRVLVRQAREERSSFSFRIGAATGEALVDTSAARDGGQGFAAGDVINTAARLQAAAQPGGVLVDATTYEVTKAAIQYDPHEPVVLKGFSSPTTVWIPKAPLRQTHDQDVHDTPLVNRVHDIKVLTGALDRSVREHTPQLVTLFGRAGIGKSRLVRELYRYAQEHGETAVRWRTGNCPPYGENVTYAAFADIVKAEAGILDTDTAETARNRLHRMLSHLVDDREVSRLANALGPLVGLPGEQMPTEDTESAWRRFVVALATDRPTVLVIEDLHWADQTMMNFVERLGSTVRDVPLLVLCTTRPELLDRQPTWASAITGSQTISLSPLTDEHVAQLYLAMFGRAAFPADALERLIELAGGNPLYAHEYFRMLVERGNLGRAGRALAAEAITAGPMPDNVHAVIANRLDLLEPEDRAVLQAASVLGVVFWPGAIAAMLDFPVTGVERSLHRLEQRDLAAEQPTSTMAGQTEYRFRHVLVRDVCYQRLPRTERVSRHVRAADWLDATVGGSGPDGPAGGRSTDIAEVLANHRYSAHEIARTLDLDTTPYAGPARRALHLAARRAYALYALDTANGHVRKALKLFGADPAEDAATRRERLELELLDAELAFLQDADGFLAAGGADRLARLTDSLRDDELRPAVARAWTLRGQAAWVTADHDRALACLRRAIEYFDTEPDSEQKVSAHAELARLQMLSFDCAPAIRAAEQARAMAERLGLVEGRISAMITAGVAEGLQGDVAGLAVLEQCVQECRALKLPSLRRALQNLAALLQDSGDLNAAYALTDEAQALVVGSSHSLSTVYSLDSYRAYLAGDWDTVLAVTDALRETPSGAWDLQSWVQSAWMRLIRDEPPGGVTTTTDEDDITVALRRATASGFPRLLWSALAHGAFYRALQGATEEASAMLTELVSSWQPIRIVPSGEWTAVVGHTAALLGAGPARAVHAMFADSPRATRWVRAAQLSAAAGISDSENDHVRAGDQHVEAAEAYRAMGNASDEAIALAAAVRSYRTADRPDSAERHARVVRAFAARNKAPRLLDPLGPGWRNTSMG
jgi:class 3 adenylate cyclase/tetratricopeptide (TPR) repeat protein